VFKEKLVNSRVARHLARSRFLLKRLGLNCCLVFQQGHVRAHSQRISMCRLLGTTVKCLTSSAAVYCMLARSDRVRKKRIKWRATTMSINHRKIVMS